MIEVEGLVKTFGWRETTLVLDHVSFAVPRGKRFGVLGAGGTGKTTLLRILATTLRPSEGSVRVGGHDVATEPGAVREIMGYVPQDLDLHWWRNGEDYLVFWSRAGGLSSRDRRARIQAVVDFLELEPVLDDNPAEYTVDKQRRLVLAQALLQDPELLILDEPMIGMGDEGREFLVTKLERLAKEGKTVVMGSPFLEDVRAACDHVAVIADGRLTQTFTVGELLHKIGEGRDARVFVDCDGLSGEAVAAVQEVPGVVDVRTTETATIVYITPMQVRMDEIRSVLESHGVTVRGLRQAHLKLGDVFATLYT